VIGDRLTGPIARRARETATLERIDARHVVSVPRDAAVSDNSAPSVN
jgi:hypothetical protein